MTAESALPGGFPGPSQSRTDRRPHPLATPSPIPHTGSQWYGCYVSGTYAVVVGDRGRLVVPAEVRERAGLVEGTTLVLIETPSGIVMMTRRQLRGGELVGGRPEGPLRRPGLGPGASAAHQLRPHHRSSNRRPRRMGGAAVAERRGLITRRWALPRLSRAARRRGVDHLPPLGIHGPDPSAALKSRGSSFPSRTPGSGRAPRSVSRWGDPGHVGKRRVPLPWRKAPGFMVHRNADRLLQRHPLTLA